MVKDPLDPVLDKIGEILKMIETNAGKPLDGVIDTETQSKLEKLSLAIDHFQDEANKMIATSGKESESYLDHLEKNPTIYSEMEKKFLRKCRDIGVHAVVLRVGLMRAIKKKEENKSRQVGANTKKSIQHRRNKFKGISGDTNWRRL